MIRSRWPLAFLSALVVGIALAVACRSAAGPVRESAPASEAARTPTPEGKVFTVMPTSTPFGGPAVPVRAPIAEDEFQVMPTPTPFGGVVHAHPDETFQTMPTATPFGGPAGGRGRDNPNPSDSFEALPTATPFGGPVAVHPTSAPPFPPTPTPHPV